MIKNQICRFQSNTWLFLLLGLLNGFTLMASTVAAAPFAYVTNFTSNDVSVIDTLNNTVVVRSIPVGTGPRNVAITPDGTKAYVTNYTSNDVSVIDTATNTVKVKSIPVGTNPSSLVITPDGKRVYVANYTSGTIISVLCGS